MDTFTKIVIGYIVLILVALGVYMGMDASKNGINDCVDAPQHCKTHEELVTEWPVFYPSTVIEGHSH